MGPNWNEVGGAGDAPRPQLSLPPLTPVVKRLLIALVAVFLGAFVLSFDEGAQRFVLHWLGLDAPLWHDLFPLVPVWQLATYGFLHSVNGLSHLLFNLLGLYFFGTLLETILGSRRFAVTCAAATIAGALLHLLMSLVIDEPYPALGASGAVLGIVVAAAALRPNMQAFLFFVPVPLKFLAALFVAFDIFGVLVSLRDGRSDGVAHWVHLGGAAWGGLAVWRGWIWRDPLQLLQARRELAAQDRKVSEAAQVDQLLEKIHREGMGSLSRRERAFLKRVSSRR